MHRCTYSDESQGPYTLGTTEETLYRNYCTYIHTYADPSHPLSHELLAVYVVILVDRLRIATPLRPTSDRNLRVTAVDPAAPHNGYRSGRLCSVGSGATPVLYPGGNIKALAEYASVTLNFRKEGPRAVSTSSLCDLWCEIECLAAAHHARSHDSG